jgi:hypothetical protein
MSIKRLYLAVHILCTSGYLIALWKNLFDPAVIVESCNRREFWKNSILEKPEEDDDDDGEFNCQASAWDFYGGKDFRIKQCTQVNQKDFVTANHEMAHTHYHMAYEGRSYLDRSAPNPGFHEAIAGIMSLSVGK